MISKKIPNDLLESFIQNLSDLVNSNSRETFEANTVQSKTTKKNIEWNKNAVKHFLPLDDHLVEKDNLDNEFWNAIALKKNSDIKEKT